MKTPQIPGSKTPASQTPEEPPVALEVRDIAEDGRRWSPSVARNRDIIRDTVLGILPKRAHVLEIASGTGEHGAHITASAEGLFWTYSDPDPESRQSQAAWARAAGHGRLFGPHVIDTRADGWSEIEGQVFDAIFTANMTHIAPFEATRGLFAGAGRHLRQGGFLLLYGPFGRSGDMAASNRRFHESLRTRDPEWGVRDLDDDLLPLAPASGLELVEVKAMPANNLMAVFKRVGTADGAIVP
ncbi:MAG: DUF938 domain-containing protein [Pseudomonadota bacterium]